MKNKIAILTEDDVSQVVAVLCDAFYDYPVMRYILQNSDDYDKELNILIHFFTMARILRKETILGAFQKSELIGVALTSNPDYSVKIPQLSELRRQTWQRLGSGAKARYEKLGRVWIDLNSSLPNLHLNMLAVRSSSQGSGVGGKLLKEVHKLSKKNPDTKGVTLTTEDPDKVSFYEYMGYQITGKARVDEGLDTWNFFRED